MVTAKQTLRIDRHHITRVEGHGNIVVDLQAGVVKECQLEIVEAPRFLEAALRRQAYARAPHIASRICGICAVSHATASLLAVEGALGIRPTEQTRQLRHLNLLGEMLDSHILHVYFLALPDLVGAGSVLPLARSMPDAVGRALRMKRLAGDLCAAIGGRHTHPICMVVGGFTRTPEVDDLAALGRRLEAMRPDVEATVELFATLALPEFERETEVVALGLDGAYCLAEGAIRSSDGGPWPLEEYRAITNEFQVSHSTAKHAHHRRASYRVGALARFNLGFAQLHPRAKAAAASLGLTAPCDNPYKNTLAQIVEIAHCLEEAVELINHLVEAGLTWNLPVPPDRLSGQGVGACEAPRGTLYHHYEIQNGTISDANCVIPTAQNLANIEADMRALLPEMRGRSPEEVTQALEMLVRAYDPCISCATHALEVRFV